MAQPKKIETVYVAVPENERAGFARINKSDLKKGQRVLTAAEVEKLQAGEALPAKKAPAKRKAPAKKK